MRLASGLSAEQVQQWYAAFGRLGFEADESQEILTGAAALIRRAYDDPGIAQAVDGLGLNISSVNALLADTLRLAADPATNQEQLFTILTELALSSEKQWASFFSASAQGFRGITDDVQGFAAVALPLTDQQLANARGLTLEFGTLGDSIRQLGVTFLSELAPHVQPHLSRSARPLTPSR